MHEHLERAASRRRRRGRAGGHGCRDLALVGRRRRARAAPARRRRAASERGARARGIRSPRRRARRDRRARRPPARAGDRRDRARLLPHRTRTAATRSSARSRRTSTSRSGTGSPCRSTTATRTTRCSRPCARVGAPERTVFHCFSGDAELAQRRRRRGLVPLVRRQRHVQERREPARGAAGRIPRDRILVETDAPYLTPVPLRGRPNAPYLVPHTLRFMAEVLGADLDEFCAQIASNTRAVYGPWHDEPVREATAVNAHRHEADGRRGRRPPRLLGPAEIRDLAAAARRHAHEEARAELRARRQHRAPHRAGGRRRSAARPCSRSGPGSARSPSGCSRPAHPSSRSRSTSASPSSCRTRCALMQPGTPLTVVHRRRAARHRAARRARAARREPAVQRVGARAAAPARALPVARRRASSWCRPRSGTGSRPRPGSKVYGAPSVKAAWYGRWRTAGQVSRMVFWPVPNVDSVLVAFERGDAARHRGRSASRRSRSSTPPSSSAARCCGSRSSGVLGGSARRRAHALDARGHRPAGPRRAAHRRRLPRASRAPQPDRVSARAARPDRSVPHGNTLGADRRGRGRIPGGRR